MCAPGFRGELSYVLASDVWALRGCQQGLCVALQRARGEREAVGREGEREAQTQTQTHTSDKGDGTPSHETD